MAYIKGTPREQQHLLPSYAEDYVSEDNPVRVIDAFVESLDLKQLGFRHTDETAVGHPSYDPKDKLKLYLYGYIHRIHSSRRLETETKRNLELKWLLKNLTPDFKTIAAFRRDHKKELAPSLEESEPNMSAGITGNIAEEVIYSGIRHSNPAYIENLREVLLNETKTCYYYWSSWARFSQF